MAKAKATNPLTGKSIRILRQRFGITLDELAKEIGCSKQQFARIETGQRPVSEEASRAICKFFVRQIEEVMSLAGNKSFRKQLSDVGMASVSTALEALTVAKHSTPRAHVGL
jgi:transcriptional regulator with XRE-family HTH domain